jgi:aspartate/methionine/tyrosine aminotransferase
MPVTAHRLNYFTKSVINQMNVLAEQHGAINLASGYPDFDPPEELLEAAERALRSGYNQYATPWGSPRLRQALSNKLTRFMDIEIDPEAHLTVTCGGTEAMLAAILAVCNPGERVIIFSPHYETYGPDMALAGAQPIFVSLHPPEFNFDPEELHRAFQAGAKALVLCNPSNPCGKVFSPQELQVIADLAQEHDAFVITDEVYEHIIYEPYRHSYIASLPGMFERTISCSSLSKTYAVTGWRLGYVVAPPQITSAVRQLHDYLTLCAPTPLQEAAVTALGFPDDYYRQLRVAYTRRRDLFLGSLDEAGLEYLRPQGAYFVLVDIARLPFSDDTSFCYWLAERVGVTGVPGSYFFHELIQHYVRLNFAKRDPTLAEAGRRLGKLNDKLPG